MNRMDEPVAPRRTWINGPSGLREVLFVALPLVISSLSWTVMTFVDRMMLRWVSGEAMSAAFQANIVWFTFMSLPLGICAYANTFVSQYFGDGQYRQIGRSVWQAIWFAVACVPVIGSGSVLAPVIFGWSNHGTEIEQLEIEYFQILCWGSGGLLVSQAASAFFSGRSKTRIVMVVDCLFALLNLVLDYVMIFGYLDFPAMGIRGAGYATAIALWLKAITYVGLMLRAKYREEYGTSSIGIDWLLIRRMVQYGGPSGVQMFLDVAGFSIFCLLLGRLGAIEAEASSMAFSISSFAFMPIFGLSLAASILVGQRLGQNRPELAARATWVTLAVALSYMAVISLFYCVTPEFFLQGFFASVAGAETNDATAQESHALAVVLLRFVAAYNLFDAMLLIFSHAIKGAGDTWFVMMVSLAMAIVLAASTYLAVEVLGGKVFTCWILITGWVWLLGTIFLLRFIQGRWKSMRVIELRHE